jgi:hypothetical protein
MIRQYYDRYQNFRINNEVKVLPFLKLPKKDSDILIEYNSKTRLDIISNTYYGTPYYGWLILQSNPEYGGLEFNIPSGSIIRIPFPLIVSLNDYQNKIKEYNTLYGI